MFAMPDNNNISPPVKICNSNVNRYFNTNILWCLHKKALDIQPEWSNGLNVSFKKLIGIDTAVNVSETDTNITRSVKKNCSLNNGNDLLQPPHCIQMTLNPQEKSSKLSICAYPSASVRIKFRNHIFASQIFNQFLNHGNGHSLSSINIRNECEGDWFGKTSAVSFSIFASNIASITTNLSILKQISSNFMAEMGFHCNRTIQSNCKLEPWLATSFGSEMIDVAASIWLKSLNVDLSCFKRINDHMQVGSMLNINTRERNAVGQIFCQYNLSDSIIRAKITSNGLVGATHEFKLWNFNVINSIVTNATTKKIIYGIQLGMEV